MDVPLLLMAAYSLFYVALDPFAGLTWAACVGLPLWRTATLFAALVRAGGRAGGGGLVPLVGTDSA